MYRRFLLVVALVAAPACGDPTGAPGDPTPIPWTPSLELAAESLTDPIVDEAFAELEDPSTAAIASIVAGAATLAADRDVTGAVTLVREARQALREAYPEEDVHAAVLDLVLLDVEERFQQALSAA